MGLLGSLFRPTEVIGIAAETLEFVLEASEDSHPNEYMGMLRGTPAGDLGLDRTGVVVTDVLVIPGTKSNPVSATVKTSQIPNDRKSVGSVHSHPNGVLRPSDEDLATFGSGRVHIITGAPYRWNDWRAFDRDGEVRELPVIDVELPDAQEFFHFTQADIDAELGTVDGGEAVPWDDREGWNEGGSGRTDGGSAGTDREDGFVHDDTDERYR